MRDIAYIHVAPNSWKIQENILFNNSFYISEWLQTVKSASVRFLSIGVLYQVITREIFMLFDFYAGLETHAVFLVSSQLFDRM